jgi:hypothetical protein
MSDRDHEEKVVPAKDAVVGSVVRANSGGPWLTVEATPSNDLVCFLVNERGQLMVTARRECFVMREK